MNHEHEPVLPADRHALLRGHLMSEIGRQGEVRRSPVRRYGWVAGPVLVGGLALALALGGVVGGGPARTPAAVGAPGASSTAGQLLERAAQAAAAASPGPDGRFVYVKLLAGYDWLDPATGTITRGTPQQRETWSSVDGTEPGLFKAEGWTSPVRPDPDDPNAPRPDGSVPTGPLGTPTLRTPTLRFMAGLPADPDELLRMLHHPGGPGSMTESDDDAFEIAVTLLREQLAPPAVTAALYRAVGRIPGVELSEDAVDAAGRHGWGVARTGRGGVRFELILDRQGYGYLGERRVAVTDGEWGPAGTVVGQAALLTRTLVGAAGDRP
ncbi:CU044_5270 family protein [Kitasatospora sp. NPDC096147]|uniref:CU044_5270 family protein n=1 Tax=Kitasatospora sp. NPDC096147 TaxID=3364093 RepID=UPI00380F1AA7